MYLYIYIYRSGQPGRRRRDRRVMALYIQRACICVYVVCVSRKLTLARFVLSPPSLRRFSTQGLLPVWWCWDVASLVLVCGSLRI